LIFTNVAKISQDNFFWFQKFQKPRVSCQSDIINSPSNTSRYPNNVTWFWMNTNFILYCMLFSSSWVVFWLASGRSLYWTICTV
jgi:hypothetical protein